ncbi:hypothetical protein [Xanthomonas phaseoli]|uniref:hypothetical protein n=1 Tax=Xanthomonas phaseoli TaxID=1985254 RepID=UPI001ED8EA1A|nr:hypothetical protein [Xanthomonas phaseoli]
MALTNGLDDEILIGVDYRPLIAVLAVALGRIYIGLFSATVARISLGMSVGLILSSAFDWLVLALLVSFDISGTPMDWALPAYVTARMAVLVNFKT